MRLLFSALFLCALTAPAGELSGRRAPGFTLPDPNVNYHDLYDYRGKVVLLDIIQTSCPACNASQKVYEKIRLKYPDKVQILAVVTAPDNADTVRAFIQNNGVKTPVLYDMGQMIASYLKLTPRNTTVALPHLFLIDAKGMIRNDWEYKGGNEKYFEQLDPLLNEVTPLVNEIGGAAPAVKGPAAAPKSAAKK